jgi:hypothetical protein
MGPAHGDALMGHSDCMARKRQARRCSAHCTDGRPCSAWAVNGGTCCAAHGGRAPQVRAKAAERVARAKALQVYERYSSNGDGPVDVLAELAHLVGVMTRFAAVTEGRLATLGEDDWALDNPDREAFLGEIRMFERAQEAASRILVDVARLGLEAKVATRSARLEQDQVDRIVGAFEAALAAIGLTDAQWAQAGPAMGHFLLHLTGDDAA